MHENTVNTALVVLKHRFLEQTGLPTDDTDGSLPTEVPQVAGASALGQGSGCQRLKYSFLQLFSQAKSSTCAKIPTIFFHMSGGLDRNEVI